MAIYRDLTIQESSDACFTLFTASTVELSSLIQTDRDTIIYADEIIVNGKVDAGSHRVRLVCRRLVFNADSSLCANGVDAPPQIKTKADPWPQAGRAPNGDGLNGENGNDGAPGVAGSPGGVIEVWADHLFGEARFFANGGAACLPQDGGDGQMGGNGVPGEHHVPLNRDGKANGRPAGRGGDVGLPGARVRGGDPGTVSVRLRQKPSDDLVPHLEARSGTPSFPAKPGQPGSAGIPGAPGSWYKMICEDIGPKSLNTLDAAFSEIAAPMRRNCFPSRPFDGERGANNTSGRLRDGEVRERQVNFPPDVVGTASLEIISDKEFGRQLDLSYVELALEAIENEYALHGADSNAQWVTRYSYLLPVIQAAASSSPALRDAAARLETLGARIGVGLDFFGFSRIHTVLLSYETYSEIIESTLLPALRTVDALWKSYRAEDENAKEKTTSLNIAIIQTEERIARIENHKKELIDRINSMIESHPDRRGTLVMLDLEVAACEAVLLEAKEELTAAIKRSYKGCDILGAIQAGAMIYAGVSTGAVGILNVASGTANLIQRISQTEAGSLGEFFESVYSLKEPLEELAKHANSVDDAVSQIQEGLARLKPDSPKLPQFVIERDKFDEVAEKFAEFAEAEGYRLAGHSFLDALQARNEAIVRYNGMLTELAEVCEARSALLRMIEMSRSAIARNMDPSGPEIILGMRRLLRETVLMTARMIHSERKALINPAIK